MDRNRGVHVDVNAQVSGERPSRDGSSARKLPRRWFQLVYSVLMSTTMVFWMTLIVTAVNIGFVDDFLRRWLRAFGVAYVFALPLTFLFNPLTQKLTARFVETGDD